jgi:hypothetical protein
MNKILIFFLILNSLSGTPENGDIIEDPLSFSEWDSCFFLKKEKKDSKILKKVNNGEEIKNYMRTNNLYSIYFQDCNAEKKWRKITRK